MVRDGYKFAIPPLVLGLVALGFGWRWSGAVLIGAIFVLLGAFVVYFFRDPERRIPGDAAAIVSPADGRVMEVVEEELDGRRGRRISIFLAIWNVHVNRAPASGRIERVEHRCGKFYAAMRSRASVENEQNLIYLATERGEIMFKQIAGWVARRVVCWKRPADTVTIGERFGLIRFGSRMDLWLPEGVEILAAPGQHVSGGASIVARWK
ncbi:MAG TPA: phosphatidylserine decarboxylase [Methylomirabilota bacterium]|nr:phosphatidylserine decarboxylase [Methylomirabilota bacterium]